MPPDTDPESMELPDVPALVPLSGGGAGGAVSVTPDGEIEELSAEDALALIEREAVLLVHGGFTARRIARSPNVREAGPHVFDLLELFAFTFPAQPCLPTPDGLFRALGLPAADTPEEQAIRLHEAAAHMLRILADPRLPDRPFAARTAFRMAEGGWSWGPGVLHAMRDVLGREGKPPAGRGFDVWNELPEWEDKPPRPAPGALPVSAEEAQERLAELAGPDAEARPGQKAFAATAALAFAPRNKAGEPEVVLAEAGTGIGKTIGYIAPASLWAERNKGTVWISTYTKNLQRQLDQELSRLYADPAEKARKAVIRKGRENYLCLLNFEEVAGRAALGGGAVTIGLVTRWARASRDGDMVGGDFPAWLGPRLANMAGRGGVTLTDRRGECVYSACPHFRKCFIERAIRKARQADIVVANHALVMRQAALDLAASFAPPQNARKTDEAVAAGAEDEEPSGREARGRFVFDEGHHIFEAADSAFSSVISGLEAAELRRWIRGAEGQRRRRGRGIQERVGDLIGENETAEEALDSLLSAASALPAPGWTTRLGEGSPRGASEEFLTLVRQQVHARVEDANIGFSLEAETFPPVDGLVDAAKKLSDGLARIAGPMRLISDRLRARLDDEADKLDTSLRIRMDAAIRGLDRRARIHIPAWQNMLASLGGTTPEEFVDWFSIERQFGREVDFAMHRHWRDPSLPFAEAVLEPAQGVLITSATLRDGLPDEDGKAESGDDSWTSAEVRTGAGHLVMPAKRSFSPSPFDYAAQSRVLVVRDVNINKADELAAAYRELFRASGGGALGLFTAIHRLRAVHERIGGPLGEAGLTLYAQHVDMLDTGTLVDIFRAERNACLLGTDAVRDGVDVPGDSLRMIVFDRTPWPRPDILHKARREIFGKGRYDDMLTRLRLKQAFGRLIRRAGDRGVFVTLDARLPTRLTTAFPPGVEVQRVGLSEAIAEVRAFLGPEMP
ncbi:ATP-dependent DNA helicase DinG [Parvibaculum indicum]|uniref:ATP-dependent DNA helicase n=1 Tax=Parvibaculum indicum TaxID=562969 RepID=UPI00141D849B|nr:ATP-dependent DNA helicase [Parvibaculum indicum]NIJ42884.1 ATP-dependent DNA helicase DinG [Parvibaculum indicum]